MINCTPHTVTVRAENALGTELHVYVYPPSGDVARVEMLSSDCDPLGDGCPTCSVEYGRAELPGDTLARRFIVSTMFADAYRRQHGDDGVELLVPDSGPDAIREGGQIVAVRRLIRR